MVALITLGGWLIGLGVLIMALSLFVWLAFLRGQDIKGFLTMPGLGLALVVLGALPTFLMPWHARVLVMGHVGPGTTLVAHAIPDTSPIGTAQAGRRLLDSSWLLALDGGEHTRVLFAPVDAPSTCALFADGGRKPQAASLNAMLQWGYNLRVVGRATLPDHRWMLEGDPVAGLQGCRDIRVLVSPRDLRTLVIVARKLPQVADAIAVEHAAQQQAMADAYAHTRHEADSVPQAALPDQAIQR